MYTLSEVVAIHMGRSFRRASWEDSTPSWFAEGSHLCFENPTGSFKVLASLDCLGAKDWVFVCDEEEVDCDEEEVDNKEIATAQDFLRDLASKFEEACDDSPFDDTSASYRLRYVADYVDRLVSVINTMSKSWHG